MDLPEAEVKHYDIVFSGPPDHVGPTFIEVEDDQGVSFKLGEWVQRADRSWVIRVPVTSDSNDVRLFQEKFDVPMAPMPSFLDLSAEIFRHKFMQEELDEFFKACQERNLEEAADALVDLVYVVHGTALMMGLPWQQLWDEVQRANMTKERAKADGSNSKRSSSLDVVKPPGWQKPNHTPVLQLRAGAYRIFNTITRMITWHPSLKL